MFGIDCENKKMKNEIVNFLKLEKYVPLHIVLLILFHLHFEPYQRNPNALKQEKKEKNH